MPASLGSLPGSLVSLCGIVGLIHGEYEFFCLSVYIIREAQCLRAIPKVEERKQRYVGRPSGVLSFDMPQNATLADALGAILVSSRMVYYRVVADTGGMLWRS